MTHMLSAAAAAAKAREEKRSAELKKFEVELRDRAKELDRQASKVRKPHVIACVYRRYCNPELSIANAC